MRNPLKWLLDPRGGGKKNPGVKNEIDEAKKRKAEKKRLLDEAGDISPKK